MEITSGKFALVEISYGGMKTSSYGTAKELVAYLLGSNGIEFLQVVKEELLPEAERLWREDEDDSEEDTGLNLDDFETEF